MKKTTSMIIMISLILSFFASCGSGFSTPAPVDRTDIKYVFVEDNPIDFEDHFTVGIYMK